MDLFDQEVAEVLADEGIRYVLRRNPCMRKKSGTPGTRNDDAPGPGRQEESVPDRPPAGQGPGAVKKLVTSAQKLRIADWSS